jgi:hypothetical protein
MTRLLDPCRRREFGETHPITLRECDVIAPLPREELDKVEPSPSYLQNANKPPLQGEEFKKDGGEFIVDSITLFFRF